MMVFSRVLFSFLLLTTTYYYLLGHRAGGQWERPNRMGIGRGNSKFFGKKWAAPGGGGGGCPFFPTSGIKNLGAQSVHFTRRFGRSVTSLKAQIFFKVGLSKKTPLKQAFLCCRFFTCAQRGGVNLPPPPLFSAPFRPSRPFKKKKCSVL